MDYEKEEKVNRLLFKLNTDQLGPAPQHEFLPTYVKSLWNDDLSTNIFQIYCDYNQIRIYLCVRKEYSLFFKLCKIDLMPADKTEK